MIQFQNKRLFFAAFLLFFSVLLTGCASKEEKAIRQTISSELDHLVSPDATQINTYLSFQLLFPDAQQDDSSDLDPSITEIFTEFYKNFSYKISEVSYDDKSASADVIIHNLDTHALAKDYAIAALKKRIEGDANPSQVDFSLSDSYLLLDKTLKNHDYKQVESDIKVQLKRKTMYGKLWKIPTLIMSYPEIFLLICLIPTCSLQNRLSKFTLIPSRNLMQNSSTVISH